MAAGHGHSSGDDAVYSRSMTALIFSENGRTASASGLSSPQLDCVGGSAKGDWSAYPHKVQCVNAGYDGSQISWHCEADLDAAVQFGDTTVVCEPYDGKGGGEGYVLRDSCRLEYALNYVAYTVKPVHVAYFCMLFAALVWVYFRGRHVVLARFKADADGDGGGYVPIGGEPGGYGTAARY